MSGIFAFPEDVGSGLNGFIGQWKKCGTDTPKNILFEANQPKCN